MLTVSDSNQPEIVCDGCAKTIFPGEAGTALWRRPGVTVLHLHDRCSDEWTAAHSGGDTWNGRGDLEGSIQKLAEIRRWADPAGRGNAPTLRALVRSHLEEIRIVATDDSHGGAGVALILAEGIDPSEACDIADDIAERFVEAVDHDLGPDAVEVLSRGGLVSDMDEVGRDE
jgi:hypothetical protein